MSADLNSAPDQQDPLPSLQQKKLRHSDFRECSVSEFMSDGACDPRHSRHATLPWPATTITPSRRLFGMQGDTAVVSSNANAWLPTLDILVSLPWGHVGFGMFLSSPGDSPAHKAWKPVCRLQHRVHPIMGGSLVILLFL